MINAFYAGSSGVQCQQKSIDVSANNIANLNSTGYQAQRMNFTDLLYTNLTGNPAVTIGHGVRPEGTSGVFTQGSLENTGRSLDLAITGKGFFAVSDQKGQVYYTRAGNFSFSVQDGKKYIVTAHGDYLLGPDGRKTVFDGQPEEIRFAGPDHQAEADRGTVKVGIFVFDNPDALKKVGNSRYLANVLTGPAREAQGPKLRQGFLEAASVDLAGEFTRLLQAQRAFQFSAKTVQVADEIEHMVNNLRG